MPHVPSHWPGSISMSQAAAVLGIAKATIYDHIHLRGAPVNEDGTVDLRRIIPWFVEWRCSQAVEEAEAHAPKESKSKHDERWKAARATLKELEVAERQGMFLRSADVVKQWTRCMAMLSQVLQSIPYGLAPRLVGREIKEIAGELERALSGAVDQVRDAYAKGQIDEPDEPTDDPDTEI